MESENGDLRSPRGGPVLEPSTRRDDDLAESSGSRAAEPRREAAEPLTRSGPGQNPEAWMAEELDQSVGGALAAGRDGESRSPFRQVSVQLRRDAHELVQQMQERSGLARSHFLSVSLLLGAVALARQLEPLRVR